MNLQDLYIYPVKSLGGIRLETAKALQRGFQFDRRWMLVDENGKFITQRVEHILAHLKTQLIDGKLWIYDNRFPENKISVNLDIYSPSTVDVTVWHDQVEATHVTAEIDKWFSTYLNKPCKLVFMSESGLRALSEADSFADLHVSFADAFPYMLISQASLDELNSRLQEPVPMNRFRPNLVVSNTMAFEEDTWAEIKIGEVRFKVIKPCARCILTTIDQETGIKGIEPLQTLSKFRKFENKVIFGQNLVALNDGLIKVNDLVEVISYR
ncbi:MAG TPA: MOSC N-terminal beta barrel domain-containing protein [Pedobacter sp.]